MGQLTPQTAARLQKILSKKIGRELSESELEQAYNALLGFAEALIDLSTDIQEEVSSAHKPLGTILPLEVAHQNTVSC